MKNASTLSAFSNGKTPSNARGEVPKWLRILQEAIRDPVELGQALDLSQEQIEAAKRASQLFPLLVPSGYLARIQPRNPADPLLRQVLPLQEEFYASSEFTEDPLQEQSQQKQSGYLKKYAARALVITTGACAIHCRYCFRRHFPYAEGPRKKEAWKSVLQAIHADHSLREIILSGGDPLTRQDSWLSWFVKELEQAKHLQLLRIHTRLPIMIPERVDDQLLQWLSGTRFQVHFVLHSNHSQELDDSVADAIQKLKSTGATLLNQAVLLRGVNDTVEALEGLSWRLIELGVMPYYLHQLDRVSGASHFEVPIEQGKALIQELRTRVPGYAVPRYVQEVPYEKNKVVIG
ncbi:EF-P beta-lysylation protein EpmB [Planctomycetales bacterium 10988]|nr:EF-P beta-lysylation protein EpmB [Planctomycetales bacterium 10988]